MPATLQIQIIGQDDSAGAFASLNANLTQLPGASDIATGALRHLGEIGVDALGQAAGAALGFARDSISAAGDFEQGMAAFENAVGQTMQGSGKSIDDFKQLFLSLGAELPVSTKEVEAAATAMAQGGIDPATIAAGSLRDTINFAAAAMKGDLVGAAEISAKTMAAWTSINDDAATKTEFMAHAQNLMAQATTAAATTVDQLFLGLSNVGGTARLAGLSFDETTTALAQLTPAFSSSADAGTSFKTFLSRLQPETQPAIAAMSELGLYSKATGSAFYDASGKFVGMAQAEALLQSATAGLTDAQKQQALQTIFGNDAIRAAALFANQGADGYTALAASIAKQTTVQEAAARNQATFNTAIENFKGSIESLQITLGSALLPVLTQVFNGTLAPAVNVVTTFANALFGSKDAAAQLSAPLQQVVAVVQQAVAAFGTGGLAGALGVLIPGFTGWLPAIQGVGAALQPLIGVLQANLVPILISLAAVLGGAVLAAIGGAAAAFVMAAAPIAALVAAGAALASAWSSNFLGIQTVVTAVLSAVWGVVSTYIGMITAFWAANGATILADVSTIWAQLQTVIATALQLIQTVVVGVLAFVAGFVAQHGALIQQVLGGAWEILSSLIQGALAVIQGIIRAVLAVIQGDWSGAWEAIKTAAAGFVTALIGVFEGAVDLLSGAADLMIAALTDVWHNFTGWSGIGGGVIDGIISGIYSAIGGLVDAAASAAKAALDAAKSALGIASPSKVFHDEVGAMIPAGVAGGIRAATPEALAALADLADKLLGVISDGVDAFGALGSFVGVTRAAVGRFGDSLALVVGMFNVVAGWFRNEAIGAAKDFATAAGTMIGIIGDALDAFAALPNLVEPSRDLVGRFGGTLALVVGNIAYVAQWFQLSAVEYGAKFADGAGTMLEVVGKAIAAFKELPNLVVPTEATVAQFGGTLAAVVGAIGRVAAQWQQTAVDHAAQFADGAGKTLSIIGGAVDGFAKLITFKAVPQEAVAAFAAALQAVLSAIEYLSASWIQAFVDRAATFAEGAGKAVGIVGQAVDGFTKLRDFQGVPAAAVTAFQVALNDVLTAIEYLSASWIADCVARAAIFAEGVGKIVSMISGAVDGFVKLAGFTTTLGQSVIADFTAALQSLLSQLVAQVLPTSVDVGTQIVAGIGRGLQSAAPTLAPILTLAIDQAIGSAVARLGEGGVTGSTGGRGGSGGGGTTISTTTNHTYTITGYNAGQASDLTSTVRQLQLLQDGA